MSFIFSIFNINFNVCTTNYRCVASGLSTRNVFSTVKHLIRPTRCVQCFLQQCQFNYSDCVRRNSHSKSTVMYVNITKKTIKQTIQSLINYFTHNSICVAHISGSMDIITSKNAHTQSSCNSHFIN